jgi:hypothetical protein
MQGHFVNSDWVVRSVFFLGEFLHFLNLENMISTHSKDFCGKISPHSPNFKNKNLKSSDFYSRFQAPRRSQ